MDNSKNRYVYFDNAATSLVKPEVVKKEVVNAIKKSQSAIESALSEVKQLCSRHAYYEASTLLGQIGYGKDATLLRKEIESAVNNADALIAKAKSINNTNEQIDCYMQALSICSDSAIAKEKLQLTPPTAPASIRAEVKGNIIHIEWSKLQSQYIQYLLIRKANGRPSSPKDGEIICETLNNAVDDTKSEAGVSYYYAVYSKCGDVFSSHAAITTTPALTVVDINPNSISLDVQENQIGFSIPFPNRAKSIEIYRDGTLIKNLTGSSYMDVNLKPEQPYTYKFITIYEDCTQKKHSSMGITQVIRPMSPPKPVKLVMTEQDDIVKLSWDKPNKGTLCIFESDKTFDILENNKVNIDNLKHRQLDVSGSSYQLRKNFSGVKYFLPITVQGNIGVAGKEVKLVSIIKPSGVSFDRNETFVLVKWKWDNISSVRIQVQVDNGNIQKYDIDSPASSNYKVELPQKAKAIKIGVASRIHVGNEVLIGEDITQTISLKAVKINFKEVKSESLFGFLSKDKYSLSIESDSILPCKIELLIAENFPPTNLVNYRTHLTISPNELKPGCVLKKEFQYTRMQKGKPVYFRLIAADRELAKQVVGYDDVVDGYFSKVKSDIIFVVIQMFEIISVLEKKLQVMFENENTGHDISHLKRVYEYAKCIQKDEGGDEYVVLVPISDNFSLFCDDRPKYETSEVRLSIFTKGNYIKLKNNIVKELLNKSFTITDKRYVEFENDTGYHHYNIDVAKYYETEEI